VGALPADLTAALQTVARVPRLLVASDFDGTLAPIVNHPGDARPLPAASDALHALAELPDTTAALISGRALRDLAALSGAPDSVALVGSHGAEFATGFAHDIDEDLLAAITAELTAIAERHPGATVEPKRASVALHVRNASPEDAESALAQATRAAAAWTARNWDFETTAGKAVLEFAVITTDKGEALDILRETHRADAVVFFGDDVTDEKAFRRLRDGDVGVKVGPGETLAAHRIDDPADVASSLELLLRERRQRD
jgi:trehalose 6-phosphate phosphatase